MKLDAKKLTRSVYTFWTVIAEVGGLFGILISLSSQTLSVLSHHKSENHLVNHLYSEIDLNLPNANKAEARTFSNSGGQSAVKEFFLECLPNCCLKLRCLRRSKKDIYFSRARELFSKETDIIALIRQLRFMTVAFKEVISAEKVF